MATSRASFGLGSILAVILCVPVVAQKRLSTAEAKDHVGETATVCGDVVSAHYATSIKGSTFLNLDKAYPNQIFTILIWGSERAKFGTPEIDYKGKRVCVTGTIAEYRGLPEVVTDSPGRIKVESK